MSQQWAVGAANQARALSRCVRMLTFDQQLEMTVGPGDRKDVDEQNIFKPAQVLVDKQKLVEEVHMMIING